MPRITSGKFKNRSLLCLEGLTTRPTLEKARAAILNSLNARFHLEDFEVIDLFAGTGAMAIEAHSWGAGHLRLVEKDRKAFALLQKNIQSLGLEKIASLYHADGLTWVTQADLRGGPYLFFLDPPYSQGLGQAALEALAKRATELNGSLVVLEHDPKEAILPPAPLHLFLEKKMGAAKLDFFEVIP